MLPRLIASSALRTSMSRVATRSTPSMALAARRAYSAEHAEETFEQFTSRYVDFFAGVDDLYELQRGLNNCFSYDLVPAPEVIDTALRAARRINDIATAVRILEALKLKVEAPSQYEAYLQALAPTREELGIPTREELEL
ncbi:cytochrome c oxidase subunit VA-domain-containing protein [Piptocephalis cylindrospora]|uniref:Cytochrome c oxidase subunit 6, mitochondrial n=1 Tax=Piptocephalis cylindrospora TaxID=1907219 RepID=A0A4P9XZR8_9FUNG|nr:cytochrome c oxidase subunit VA-domain-containing protein [Piptocephalis cylindrospora]|eukprot:RKP11945.1 cytochrome c oxidase subunit VA-domain-containing protein [Piptocephalis cylindrospora]